VRSHGTTGGAQLTISQISYELGKPVRVLRGHKLPSKYAPIEGFVVGNVVDGAVNSLSLDIVMTAFTK